MRFVHSACFFVILASAELVAQSNSHLPANQVNFSQPVTYDVGTRSAEGIAIADVNGDGNLDLLIADQIGVAVLLGNGDGTFQPAVNYSSGGFDAYSVAVGDVNGDGKPDLVVSNYCSDENCPMDGGGGVGVLLGNGDGTFQPVMVNPINGEYNLFSLALADLNGDGKLDIVVGEGACGDVNLGCDAGQVGILMGNGDGTFKEGPSYDPGGLYTQSVALADVNGDGKLDILAGSCRVVMFVECGTGIVTEFLGNGDGTFQQPTFYGTRGDGVLDIVATNLTGDAIVDLLVANGLGVTELIGDGSGSFQTRAIPLTPFPYSLATADLNGDGNVDVVLDYACAGSCSGEQFGAVGFALGRGNGSFQLEKNTVSSGGSSTVSVAVGDLNGDGKPDVVVSNFCGGSSKCTGDGTVGVLLNGSSAGAR
jgi:FG-GAP-like repeat